MSSRAKRIIGLVRAFRAIKALERDVDGLLSLLDAALRAEQ